MTEKWYKQFWPWFLITAPLASISMGVLIVYLALTTEHSMVSDDYYKEGKGINVSLQKTRMAKQLNLLAGFTLIDNAIVVTFKQALPPGSTAIKLDFFHATLENKDFYVMLTRDAGGVYRGTMSENPVGNWRVTLTPFDGSWKIRQQVSFPIADEVLLEP